MNIEIAHPQCFFADGQWQPATGVDTIDVVSPHSEAVIFQYRAASSADVDRAVTSARQAFDEGPWPRLTHDERAQWVRKLSAALEPRMPDIIAAWSHQVGMLASMAPFVVGGGKQTLDHYADWSADYPWETRQPLNETPGTGLIVKEPVGVVAAIAPWNNPFGIMTAKLAPALIAGCPVIMKPSPETPIEAFLIAEAAEAIGFPKGVINLVIAGREVSDHLVCHKGVDKVSFTGSVPAGQRIASVCGNRLARCTLELGGKSAAIVLDDYDIDAAAAHLAGAICMSSGQICASLSRALVPEHLTDRFVDAAAKVLGSIKVGSPYDPESQMGPLAMGRQRDRVETLIAQAEAEGAVRVIGGDRSGTPETGYYINPCLFRSVTTDMRIAQEEVFGPVLSVMSYKDEADAIRIANSTEFGLFGAVFTHDSDAALRIARAVRTGTMSQNGFRFDSKLPFGGFKKSGIGREGGPTAFEPYTETKSIMLD